MNILNQLLAALPQACVFEPQSPHQAKDAEEGKKLLVADAEALLNAVEAGDLTKVGRMLSPRLCIPATPDCACARADARTLIPPHPTPLFAL